MTNELVAFLGNLFTTPLRSEMPKSPSDYGLNFEEMSFKADDGVELKAWYIPAEGSDKLILMTHPMLCTRYGYVVIDALKDLLPMPVEFMPTVKHLHDEGYNVLFMDFRNHGQSGEGSNGVCGVGHFESQDVVAMKKFVDAHPLMSKMTKGFVSHCMGANATFKAMAEQPEQFADIRVLTTVQALSSDVALRKVMKMQAPDADEQAILEAFDQYMQENKGLSLWDTNPRKYIPQIKVPVFYAQVKNDVTTDPSDTQDMYDMTPTEKELHWIEGDHPRFYGYNYFGENPEKLLNFVNKYMA